MTELPGMWEEADFVGGETDEWTDCVMVLDPGYRDGTGWLEEIEPPKRIICYREGGDDIEAKLRGFAKDTGYHIIAVYDRSK